MSTTGFIFSNLNENTLSLLTSDRTVAAIPFGCRYRLVDFALSNMVNSGINDINLVMNYNYRSLVNHIGSGKDWDLARSSGGISFISPGQFSHSTDRMFYSHRLDALISIREHLTHLTSDTVVLCDAEEICNLDLNAIISMHRANNAEITLVTVPVSKDDTFSTQQIMIQTDPNGKVTDIVKSFEYSESHPERSIRMMVIDAGYLNRILEVAVGRNFHSFTNDILMRSPENHRFYSYSYSGFTAAVSSFLDYYNTSMRLTSDAEARNSLLGRRERPIFTRVHNSPPTVHGEGSHVVDSLIADGCTIEGTVENSILFRGVKVSKGAVVKNSILFGGTYVGEGSSLNCIVADKDVFVSDNRTLSGAESMPFYIAKHRKV